MTYAVNTPLVNDTSINVYALMGQVVADTSVRFGKDVFFTHGPRKEIIESLIAMGQNNTTSRKRYPLMAVVGNVPIAKGDPTCYGEGTFNLVIATLSSATKKADIRFNEVYIPTLQPIYRHFLNALYDSGLFDLQDMERLSYEYVENFDYAKGRLHIEGAVSPDIIDAIEIKNLKLKIKSIKNC